MTIDHAPSRSLKAFRCPFCNIPAGQTWRILGYESYDSFSGSRFFELGESAVHDAQMASWVLLGRWASSQCINCNELAIWRDEEIVHPARPRSGYDDPHELMPNDVKDLYEEARDVVIVSRRAGAAIARAALERLAKNLDSAAPRNASLDERIARLHSSVSEPLWQLLTVLRHTGNKSLHVDTETDAATILVLDPDDEVTLPVLFSAINLLVDERIAIPARAAILIEQLPLAVREGAERRAAAADQIQELQKP